MLQHKLTQETYNYAIESLSSGSNKRICVLCDYCGKQYTTTMKQSTKGNEFVD